jgi:hypothetical protein
MLMLPVCFPFLYESKTTAETYSRGNKYIVNKTTTLRHHCASLHMVSTNYYDHLLLCWIINHRNLTANGARRITFSLCLNWMLMSAKVLPKPNSAQLMHTSLRSYCIWTCHTLLTWPFQEGCYRVACCYRSGMYVKSFGINLEHSNTIFVSPFKLLTIPNSKKWSMLPLMQPMVSRSLDKRPPVPRLFRSSRITSTTWSQSCL